MIELSWSYSGYAEVEAVKVVMQCGEKQFISPLLDGKCNHYIPPAKLFSPRQKWQWQVICIVDGKEIPGKKAFFETGLMNENCWRAEWIGYPAAWNGCTLVFQREFVLSGNDPDKLRIYIAAPGGCTVKLDGKKLSDAALDPATSDYAKRIMFRTLTAEKLDGKNHMLVIEGGSGWYGHPVIRYQVEYDGNIIAYSTSFRDPVIPGAYIHNAVYDGVTFDARKKLPESAFLPGGYINKLDAWPMRVSPPGGRMVPQVMPPMRPVKEYKPQEIIRHNEFLTVIDFGQNISGRCRLNFTAADGEIITIRYAEVLDENRHADQRNLLMADSCDRYISNSEPVQFEPDFTLHGFRYVEISGKFITFDPEKDAVAVEVVGDFAPHGTFECSNKRLNAIWQLVAATERSGLAGIPCDCPQRSERLGWLNDLLAHSESTVLQFDVASLWEKFLDDVYDAQEPDTGKVPLTVPVRWDLPEIEPVASGFVDIAMHLIRYHGKKAVLLRNKELFEKWADALIQAAGREGIIRTGGIIGDWVPPEEFAPHGCRNATVPKEFVTTALAYRAVNQISEILNYLGDSDKAEKLANAASSIFDAFQKEYYHGDGIYASGSQASQVYALACGLIPEEIREKAFSVLVKHFDSSRKFGVGNIGLKFLFELFIEFDRPDLALKIIDSDEYPGWGYMIANGATTIWERWEKKQDNGMNSLNHPMHGAVGSFLIRGIAGIRLDDKAVGGDKIILAPRGFNQLSHVCGAFDTSRGKVFSAWNKDEDGTINWEISLPPGCTAKIDLPPELAINEKILFVKGHKKVKLVTEGERK